MRFRPGQIEGVEITPLSRYADDPAVIVIPPGVVHGYRNIGDGEAMIINLPNRLYAGQGKKEEIEEIRHESNAGSPYQMQE